MTVLNKLDDTRGVFMSRSGKNSWLQTGSGRRVSVLSPLQKEIDITDIARALAKQCRFNGHCTHFYSVAQHCVEGAMLALKLYDKDVAFAFMLHDASEAYVGDMIKPVKVMDEVFQSIEDNFSKVINKKFGVKDKLKAKVKHIDNIMCAWEKRDLLPNSEPWPNMIELLFRKVL